jgi:hypothetical protein
LVKATVALGSVDQTTETLIAPWLLVVLVALAIMVLLIAAGHSEDD